MLDENFDVTEAEAAEAMAEAAKAKAEREARVEAAALQNESMSQEEWDSLCEIAYV